jgi:hypothetical protein
MKISQFVIGSFVGALVSAAVYVFFFRPPAPPPFEPGPGGPEAREEMLVRKFSHDLGLNPTQSEAIRPIVFEFHRKMLALHLSELDHVRRLMDEFETALSPTLNREQSSKLRDICFDLDRKRAKESEFLRQGPTPPGPDYDHEMRLGNDYHEPNREPPPEQLPPDMPLRKSE